MLWEFRKFVKEVARILKPEWTIMITYFLLASDNLVKLERKDSTGRTELE